VRSLINVNLVIGALPQPPIILNTVVEHMPLICHKNVLTDRNSFPPCNIVAITDGHIPSAAQVSHIAVLI